MMCQEIAPFALYCKDVLGNSSIYTQMMCQKIALFALQRCVRKQLHLHSNDVPGNSSICTLTMCKEIASFAIHNYLSGNNSMFTLIIRKEGNFPLRMCQEKNSIFTLIICQDECSSISLRMYQKIAPFSL